MHSCLPPNTDPFFFDGEDLREIADERIIKAGLTLFKDHKVIECYQENDLLLATLLRGSSLRTAPRTCWWHSPACRSRRPGRPGEPAQFAGGRGLSL